MVKQVLSSKKKKPVNYKIETELELTSDIFLLVLPQSPAGVVYHYNAVKPRSICITPGKRPAKWLSGGKCPQRRF